MKVFFVSLSSSSSSSPFSSSLSLSRDISLPRRIYFSSYSPVSIQQPPLPLPRRQVVSPSSSSISSLKPNRRTSSSLSPSSSSSSLSPSSSCRLLTSFSQNVFQNVPTSSSSLCECVSPSHHPLPWISTEILRRKQKKKSSRELSYFNFQEGEVKHSRKSSSSPCSLFSSLSWFTDNFSPLSSSSSSLWYTRVNPIKLHSPAVKFSNASLSSTSFVSSSSSYSCSFSALSSLAVSSSFPFPDRFFSPPSLHASQNWCMGGVRTVGILASVTAGQMTTREYEEAFLPRRLKRIKVFNTPPPRDLPAHFHKLLDKAHSNPRSILKLYRKYIKIDDHPDYSWLVRCFCQLANTFGFNSFWATKDKQVVHSIPSFKFLVYDLIERKHLIQASEVPRLLYALAAIEYRSWHLLPTLLEHVDANLHRWRAPTLCNMALSLALMGVGDNQTDQNQFGPVDCLSRDYTGVISKLASEVQYRLLQRRKRNKDEEEGNEEEEEEDTHATPLRFRREKQLTPLHDEIGCTPFDYTGLAFALTLIGDYDLADPQTGEGALPLFLRRACSKISLEQLEHSGWVQFFLYQTLYCTDVEKPKKEVEIKKAVPFPYQQHLHLSWLDKVLVNAQSQGSEMLQVDVDGSLRRLYVRDALINCSAGRQWDEQHCWFVGHLVRSRNLALEYDYLMPLGPGRPKVSGWLACKKRLLNLFGLNVATIHRCYWDMLNLEQKDVQLTRLLANFPPITGLSNEEKEDEKPLYGEDKHLRFLRHKRQKFETWPPEKIEI